MLALALWTLAACSPKQTEDTDSGVSGADSVDSETAGDSGAGDSAETGETAGEIVHPNWTDDIAPWVYSECVDCHYDGGIGPFNLDGYEEAAAWSNQALVAMQARTMPPYLVDNSGECGNFASAR